MHLKARPKGYDCTEYSQKMTGRVVGRGPSGLSPLFYLRKDFSMKTVITVGKDDNPKSSVYMACDDDVPLANALIALRKQADSIERALHQIMLKRRLSYGHMNTIKWDDYMEYRKSLKS